MLALSSIERSLANNGYKTGKHIKDLLFPDKMLLKAKRLLVAGNCLRLIRFLEVSDLFLRQRDVHSSWGMQCEGKIYKIEMLKTEHWDLPTNSSRFLRLVVPTMGADTPDMKSARSVTLSWGKMRTWLWQAPCERDLGHCYTFLLSEFFYSEGT